MKNIAKKVLETFYEELTISFAIYSEMDVETYEWKKKAEKFDLMLNCLGGLNEVIKSLGGTSKVDYAKGEKPNLFSTMVVTFKIPKKMITVAKSDAKLFFESKGINYSSLGVNGTYLSVHL